MSNKSTNPEKAKPPGGADLTCIILYCVVPNLKTFFASVLHNVIVSCIFSACHLILIKVSSKTYQLRFIITTCIDSAISVCCLRMISMLYQFSVSYQSQLALSYKQSLRWTQVSILSKLSQPGTIWLMQNADGTVSFRELLGQTKVMQIRQV